MSGVSAFSALAFQVWMQRPASAKSEHVQCQPRSPLGTCVTVWPSIMRCLLIRYPGVGAQ